MMGVSEEQHPGQPEEYLSWSQEQRIALPSEEELMVVRVRQFQRLHRRVVEALSRRRMNYSVVYSSLFGAAVAIAASVPALMWANGLPAWVAVIYIFAASVCSTMGLMFVFVGRALGNRDTSTASDIDQEFHDLGNLYPGEKFKASPRRPSPK